MFYRLGFPGKHAIILPDSRGSVYVCISLIDNPLPYCYNSGIRKPELTHRIWNIISKKYLIHYQNRDRKLSRTHKKIEYHHNTTFRYVTKPLKGHSKLWHFAMPTLSSGWLTIGCVYHPDDLTRDDISSGSIMSDGVCHVSDTTNCEPQIIWMTSFRLPAGILFDWFMTNTICHPDDIYV